jgi:acetyl esterase/lipase
MVVGLTWKHIKPRRECQRGRPERQLRRSKLEARMNRALIAALFFVLGVGTASGQGSVQTKTNLEYAVHDGVPLFGDLYTPATGGPHPAMLFIHGGGFARGSKAGYGNTWGPYLAARGYEVFAIDYRLSKPTQATWPQALLDCKAGLQYLRGNAAMLGIDPDRIGVGGDSAGAALAALVAVTQDLPEFANRYPMDAFASASTKVKVAVPIYGVYDMMAQEKYEAGLPNGPRNLDQFFGGTPSQLSGEYFESSALNYIREAATSLDSVATPNAGAKIPWFLAWGMADPVVPPTGQSIVFVQALRDAGATVTVVAVPKTDHYWFPVTPISGKKGEPECDEITPAKFSCSGATPNDFIVSQLLDFLAHNL